MLPTQKPATAPKPASRPAHALPASCSDGGKVSTRRARSAAMTGGKWNEEHGRQCST